jgi:adenine-specific DNA-methyltransferase
MSPVTIKTDSSGEENSPSRCRLIHADAAVALDMIADESVALIVSSPPYNIGKSYERDTKMSLQEYIEWLTPIIKKLADKVRPDGSVCWQTGNYVENGEVFPLDVFFYNIFVDLGFKLRNRIIWRFNFGLHATKRFSGRYETLLWFTKSDDYQFNLDPVRVPQLYPGKRHSANKGANKAGKPSGNPKGKNPSDFWTFSPEDAFRANPVWDIPNVKANHPEKTIHPCQFPHELAERCILALTKPGDIVLDPFVGAGTTAIAALGAERQIIGIDKSQEYIALTAQRLDDLINGLLSLRPSGRDVRLPKAGEGVASVPPEWTEAA